MGLNLLLLIFSASYLCHTEMTVNGEYLSPESKKQYFEPFPKILWAFWATGLDNSRLYTKLCINNMHYYSEKSGFQFRFLTDQNYTDYLSPESNARMQKLLTNEKEIGNPQKASILRGFLMYEHGGIWADAHTILTSDFSWIDNLYKWSGVYNRFHPNPDVVFFTKNKDYSGNKTRLFDQKRQQQVYLFPGMQNWFLIAKPKSKFYTDLIYSFERYVRIGREQILKDSKSKGIQFHGESLYYFKFGSFQLQLVLQNKQKQLDSMKSATFKYAVEYYKMWNIHSEYSGFILLAYLNSNQQVDFHFQYDQYSISELYQFKISTPFVKDIGTVTKALENSFASSNHKTCHDVPNTLQKNSFIYRYLISIPSMFEEINFLKQSFSHFEGQCNPLASTVGYIKYVFIFLKVLILGAFLNLFVYGLIHPIVQKIKREGYAKIQQQ